NDEVELACSERCTGAARVQRPAELDDPPEAAETAFCQMKGCLALMVAARRPFVSGDYDAAVTVGNRDGLPVDAGQVHDDLDAGIGLEHIHRRAVGRRTAGEIAVHPAGPLLNIHDRVGQVEKDASHSTAYSSGLSC